MDFFHIPNNSTLKSFFILLLTYKVSSLLSQLTEMRKQLKITENIKSIDYNNLIHICQEDLKSLNEITANIQSYVYLPKSESNAANRKSVKRGQTSEDRSDSDPIQSKSELSESAILDSWIKKKKVKKVNYWYTTIFWHDSFLNVLVDE